MAIRSESFEDFAVHADVELHLLRGLRGDGSDHGLPMASRLFLHFYGNSQIVPIRSIRSSYISDNHLWEQWEKG
jgi:hypothetical protein